MALGGGRTVKGRGGGVQPGPVAVGEAARLAEARAPMSVAHRRARHVCGQQRGQCRQGCDQVHASVPREWLGPLTGLNLPQFRTAQSLAYWQARHSS